MSDDTDWLKRFGASHDGMRYPAIYWAAAPTFVAGFTGLLWLLPVPEAFADISPLLNWGSAFLMTAAVYYFIISLPIAIGLLPFLLAIAIGHSWLADTAFSPERVSTGLTLAGLIGLWLGQTKRASLSPLVNDVMLSVIAPAFLLSVVYRRFGIPY
jgi:hypothetical protein